MPLVQSIRRIAGAVAGAAATLRKYSAILYFDPADFDVDDNTTTTLGGSATDPGIGTGYTRVRARAGAGGNVPTTRTLAGSSDIWIDGSASAKDLSANRSFTIQATANANGGTVMRRNDSGGTGLNGIAVDAGATWLDSQAQSLTGTGTSRTWSGQDAKTGAYSGGTMDFIPGARGNSDNWSGDFRIALGPEDDNDARSAYLSLFTASDWSGTPFLRISSDSSSAKFEAPAGLVLTTNGTGNIVIAASGGHSLSLGAKPTITGSKGGNVALANLLTALAGLGLLTDSTT